ncbi:MAG: zinc ABC transporter substrate-binding protein [Nitratireductor sp.]
MKPHKRPLLASAIALGILTLAACPSMAAPEVVVSIKPLHSLVAAVMQGAGIPALIVEGASSPHTYNLRPSQARELQDADVVFWVGHGLEAFLEKPLRSLAADAVAVELEDTPELVTLPLREGGNFERDADTDGSHHDHGAVDPHFWLDPENAKLFVKHIANTLVAVDPANAATYQHNADGETARINALMSAVTADLEPVRAGKFIVFHDGYHYFENRFGLEAAAALTVNPEIMPSAKRISEIRQRVTELGATCVFSEPQFKSTLVDLVSEGTGARTGILDPLGASLPAGPALYFTLIRNMADAFRDCLAQTQ